MPRTTGRVRLSTLLATFILCFGSLAPAVAQQQPIGNAESTAGPVRLRPMMPNPQTAGAPITPGAAAVVDAEPTSAPAQQAHRRDAYVPGEFERFVQRQAGELGLVRRLGADLVSEGPDGAPETSPAVPADYVVAPGDELLVTIWGSVDADLRLVVDRAGRVSIPRVGTVQVAGVRNVDLTEVLTRRVGQVFKNFQLSVSMGQLRGIRVFVTGFVVQPGIHAVGSLSTIVTALMTAGGPTAAGSFRQIELRRGGSRVAQFDLYDLLLGGDRASDRMLQAGDVVHVLPVGTQVGIIGSVNKPAVLELKPGETVGDVLRMAGGFSAVADRTRVALERLADRNAGRVVELQLPRDTAAALGNGDVLRAFSAVSAVLATGRQSKRVVIEGEVARPAEYVLPEGGSLRDALKAAGGLTPNAYLYATEITRESVRRSQQENYDRALRDMEAELARATGSQRVSSGEDAAAQSARVASSNRLLERLRQLRPNGRIVLQLATDTTELPDLSLEDGDRVLVPARPTTVGVFGSVFNAASYLYVPGRSVGDYLQLAGGPTRGADERSVFVVRANGTVISERQRGGFFASSGALRDLPADPGDTVFVPEETDRTTFLQAAKDWTQILFQFGLGVAGIKSAVQ